MSSRKFNASRLYKLTKAMVIGISLLSGFYAAWAFYQLQTNTMLQSWQEYCRKNPDDPQLVRLTGYTCMGSAFEQINQVSNLMFITGAIAVSSINIFRRDLAL